MIQGVIKLALDVELVDLLLRGVGVFKVFVEWVAKLGLLFIRSVLGSTISALCDRHTPLLSRPASLH